MAKTQTSASFATVLKELYFKKKVEDLVMAESPVLGLLNKQAVSGGVFPVPIRYANSQNRSANFVNGQAGSSAAKYSRWNMDVVSNYAFAFIGEQVILESKNNAGAFLSALQGEIDSAIENIRNDLSTSLYRKKDGARASVDTSYSSGNTINISNAGDIVGLEVGMTLNAGTGTDVSTPRSGDMIIQQVDRDNLTIVVNAAAASLAAGDVLFVKGDANSKISGMASWLPSGSTRATELSTSFFGVTRDEDSVRLGGVEISSSFSQIREALIAAESRLRREGAVPKIILMNPLDFGNLQTELDSFAQFQKMNISANGGTGVIGYEAVQLAGSGAKIVQDPYCPAGVAYAIDPATWTLYHLGNSLVEISDLDSLDMLRSATAASVEIRIRSYANLGCHAPGKNAVIQLPS